MEQETPTTKHFAGLVLENELADSSDPNDLQSAVERIFDKLNAHLSIRFGSGGYHALLRRALTLAADDVSVLASVHISEDGSVEGFQGMTDSQSISDGSVAMLARLIELLDTFIGRNLTVRVLQNVWPNVEQVNAAGRPGESIG